MKFIFFVLLLISSQLPVYSQQLKNSAVQGSWIGTIKMEDTNPELVFNIFTDSLGELAGSLGVPSKGIRGIPLSKVQTIQDSVVFELSAAQASYNGVYDKDKSIIFGIWTESQSQYNLILKPLTREIDYDNFQRENTSSLPLKFTSKNFRFYSEAEDAKALQELAKTLESNYLRIITDMNTSFNSAIDVFIYPNVKAFHRAVGIPDAPDWVVGAASKNELKMVSPLNPGSVHSYESLMKAIVHELAHTVVLNFRKNGLIGLPNWLNEGYAYYEANQLTKAEGVRIQSALVNNKIPTWKELEQANITEFGDLGGYGISATIIEFLVATYGLHKLKEFIIAPDNLERIYEVSKSDLERLWLEYLKNRVE